MMISAAQRADAVRHMVRGACVTLACSLLFGCGVFITRAPDNSGFVSYHGVYPAVQFDTDVIRSGRNAYNEFLLACGAVLDLPFSITFDTLLLPYDLTRDDPTRRNYNLK